MLEGQFSRTALGAAGHRAVHQTREGGRIFSDPLAARILGADFEAMLAEADEHPARRGLRLFIAARSRFAETVARRALGEGARQIVVLGAGLDTFAYRLEAVPGLRVFEVDHPATQAEKRRRVAAADIAIPDHLTYAPCDFERHELGEALRAAGFDAGLRSVFLWLGVTPYLTRPAIEATLRRIAGFAGGAEIVFDYANPPDSILDPEQRRAHELLVSKVASAGEAFQTYFDTAELREYLQAAGFDEVEDLGPGDIAQTYFGGGAGAGRKIGGHVVRAKRGSRAALPAEPPR